MMTRILPLRIGLLALASALGSPAFAQSPDRARVRTEVATALEVYVGAFSQGRADFIADSVYVAPAYFLGGSSVEVRMTSSDVRAHFERMMEPLPAQGYQRSEIRSSRVCVLSNIAAIAHLGFARVRTDGSVIVAGDAAYFYTKTPE
ncbi:MAG: hypothetical protein OEN00_18135, partial [Gemmatimonadota bacterium]|nr:hypothetical protein [Gemmatimonadota bacterium]